jgi:hypothetical protein
MKNLFAVIFRNHSKEIPEGVKRKFYEKFPDAINVEWENKRNIYEAVFYLNDIEHIAQLNTEGELAEYKKNLWPGELPDNITLKSSEIGEIMNSIVIFKNNTRIYEVIIRDINHHRKLLLFDVNANLINSEKL